MLYMVEIDFQHASRELEWNKWYDEHVAELLSMPGLSTAQRFKCLCPHPSPYLAVYSVPGPQFFESDAYRRRGGRGSTGAWRPLMTNWHRNLYQGLDIAPEVRADQVLIMTEVDASSPALQPWKFHWLDGAGLDQTIGRRGIAVVPSEGAETIWAQTGAAVRPYKPLGARLTGAACCAGTAGSL